MLVINDFVIVEFFLLEFLVFIPPMYTLNKIIYDIYFIIATSRNIMLIVSSTAFAFKVTYAASLSHM